MLLNHSYSSLLPYNSLCFFYFSTFCGAQLSMCRTTGTFHSHNDDIFIFFFRSKLKTLTFLNDLFTGISKMILKRDDGLYNLYVMYLITDANSALLNKRQDVSLISKFNWKFQLWWEKWHSHVVFSLLNTCVSYMFESVLLLKTLNSL